MKVIVAITAREAPTEGLRLVAGLVAGGHEVRLVESGPGRGVLSASDDLPEEAEAYLRGIAEFGVVPEPVDARALRADLLACDAVLRLGDPSRSGEPAVLDLSDEAIRSLPERELLTLVVEAGQVIRT